MHMSHGDYEPAEDDFRKGLEIEPNTVSLLMDYSYLLITLKRYEEVEPFLARLNQINKRYVLAINSLLSAAKGDKEKALQHNITYIKTRLYALLDMKEEAITYLKERLGSIDIYNYSWYFRLTKDPIYDNIRDDPRFQELVKIHKRRYEENLRKYGDIDI